MPPTTAESKRSQNTARAFLKTLVEGLGDGIIDDYKVATDTAIATVRASNGERYNISVHKLAMEGSGPKPGKQPPGARKR